MYRSSTPWPHRRRRDDGPAPSPVPAGRAQPARPPRRPATLLVAVSASLVLIAGCGSTSTGSTLSSGGPDRSGTAAPTTSSTATSSSSTATSSSSTATSSSSTATTSSSTATTSTTQTSQSPVPTHAPAFPSRDLLLSPAALGDAAVQPGERWVTVDQGRQHRWDGCTQTSGAPAEASIVLSKSRSSNDPADAARQAIVTQVLSFDPTPWRCQGPGWSPPAGTGDVIIQRYNGGPGESPFAVYRIVAESGGVWSVIQAGFGETMEADDRAREVGVAALRRLEGLPPLPAAS